MIVVADNKIPFLKGALEPFADVVYASGKEITNELLKSTSAEALLIRTRTKCNHDLLGNTNVSFIATATIGYDHVDTDYCSKNGIVWTNAPGCNSSSVKQYISSALVTLAKKKGFDLKDRTLGVIGVGNVGSKVVRAAEQLDMKIYMNDPPRQRKENVCQLRSLDTILRECDILTFHVPLNLEGEDVTFHMADKTLFDRVNKGTIIINSSRGEVVNTNDLKNAIQSGKLGGVVLDVWEREPFIDAELLNMTDIVTPHIAGYSADGKANGTSMSIRSLSRFFNLGIDDWEPEDIPVPPVTKLKINCRGKSDDQIISEAILGTYDILEDDIRLRNSVETFEKQRGDYPLRREFQIYTILLSEERPEVDKRLRRLGFKTENYFNI